MAENQEPAVELFDVDGQVAEYRPVAIRFRGEQYILGANALQIVAAAGLAPGDGIEGIVAQLPAFLRTLCPDIGKALDGSPLSAAEEVALLRPITAVMESFSAISKSTEAEG